MNRSKYSALLFWLFSSLFACQPASAQLIITYPNTNGLGEQAFGYQALKLALDTVGADYELLLTQEGLTQGRTKKLILENKISIADFGSSKQDEETLLPIYFPIDMGLNGWRLMVIHTQNQGKFSYVKDAADLQYAVLAQGAGWADSSILSHNGLKVYEASGMNSLFMMAAKKRVDAIPLGVNEAHALLAQANEHNSNLIVESELLLKYPFARLFFVNRNNQALHDLVKRGLEMAFDNGSFMALFRQYPGHQYYFNSRELQGRRVIPLNNPYITRDIQTIPSKYFLP